MVVVKAHHPKKGQIVKTFWDEREAAVYVKDLQRQGYKPGLR